MSGLRDQLWSSVGKKLLTGITGFLLMGYIILHLLGNLTLLIGPSAFNAYAHFLEGLAFGKFVYVFEVGLLIILGVHLAATVTVAVTDKTKARPVAYAKREDAGFTSRMTLSSKSMIYTGVLIALFIIWHVKSFKFGGAQMIPDGHGGEIKDLYSVVAAAFAQPLIVGVYVAMMILIGLHLRHGFWSAFQSLGWTKKTTLPILDTLAMVFAVVMAFGFLIIPIIMYFGGGGDAGGMHAGGWR
jgi:succinate dehydrogenase / fumarate reductase cytochrome b subunit